MLLGAVAGSAYGAPGDNTLVSVNQLSGEAAGTSSVPVIDASGRYVLFGAHTNTLVPGDTNSFNDVYLRDLVADTTERISVGFGGVEPDGFSVPQSISAGGRFAVFRSMASNLVAGGSSDLQVFVRDRAAGLTEKAFVGLDEPSSTHGGSISDDGRFLTFGSFDIVYLTDRLARTTTKIAWGFSSTISGNGRYVVYSTRQNPTDLVLWDRLTTAVQRITKFSSDGGEYGASISADGRWVSFISPNREAATDLNPTSDVFLWDRVTGETRLVTQTVEGAPSNGPAEDNTSVSDDGRYVAFTSLATNLAPGETSDANDPDVYLKDMQTGAVERVTGERNGITWSGDVALSSDGRLLAFATDARLVPNDLNSSADVYVHETGRSSTPPATFDFYLRPLVLEYGSVRLGSSLRKGFTLTNKGTAPLAMKTIELLGPNRAQYALKSYCGATVDVDRWCWIAVTFKPTSIGYQQANLHVVAGGIDRHRALRGTGVR